MPHRAASPKSSRDVTSACTSVLHALSGRDDRIRGSPAIDIVESSGTLRSRMLAECYMRRCQWKEEVAVEHGCTVLRTVSPLSSSRLKVGSATPAILSRQ